MYLTMETINIWVKNLDYEDIVQLVRACITLEEDQSSVARIHLQIQVTPTPEASESYSLCRQLYSCIYPHIDMHTYI